MTARQLLAGVAIVVAVLLGARCSSDPHRTALPFGSTDLSSVEQDLARLPADERKLVEDYVARSKGNVLPAQFADPDDPLTARTFGEAIELQRNWEARRAVDDARAAELAAQRDARMAPLRALVRARVIASEVREGDADAASVGPGVARRAGSTNPAFITRVRVDNLGDEAIVALTGSLHARDREAVLRMDLCWIDLGRQGALPARGHVEFDCGNPARIASEQQRDFVRNPPGRFEVVWEPNRIQLAGGRVLEAGL